MDTMDQCPWKCFELMWYVNKPQVNKVMITEEKTNVLKLILYSYFATFDARIVQHVSSEENCNDACHIAIYFRSKHLSVTTGRPASTVRNSCMNNT